MSAENLEQAFAITGGVLENVRADQLGDSTPCKSWDVRGLANHIIGGATFFATIAETGKPPENPSTDDLTGGDMHATFAAGAKRAVDAFRAEGAMEKTFTLPFGEIPGSVFVWIAATDTFTHGWDLARATGQSSDLDPALAEMLLEQIRPMIPDMMRGPDGQSPFGPVVEVASDAPAADRLAGFLGRQV
jgi:uncharacterized protein (TIGR03086 family)